MKAGICTYLWTVLRGRKRKAEEGRKDARI